MAGSIFRRYTVQLDECVIVDTKSGKLRKVNNADDHKFNRVGNVSIAHDGKYFAHVKGASNLEQIAKYDRDTNEISLYPIY